MQNQSIIDQIVAQNLGVYREMPSRLRADVSQEAQVAGDYRGRLVFELLQNADDAMTGAATTSDRVSLLVTGEELWIANSGRALTEDDVAGLCGLGESSKAEASGTRRASIGHKGVGFKSVLEITERPEIYSDTYSFSLGTDNARPLVDDLWATEGRAAPPAVPSMRFPRRIAEPSRRWIEYAEAGFNVAFRFPFRDSLDRDTRHQLADQLLSLPLTTVLFLKHLDEIEIRVEQGAEPETPKWVVDRARWKGDGWTGVAGLDESGVYRVRITNPKRSETFLVAHDADVAIGPNRVGLSGPAWQGVERTEVSVAAIEPGGGELRAKERRFHVFLPTGEHSPYPLLVNGAFSTDLSRQRVRVSTERGDYNAHLIRAAASLFRQELVPRLREHGEAAVLEVLDRTASVESEPGAAQQLLDAVRGELSELPILPLRDGSLIAPRGAVVPSLALEEHGESYRSVLLDDATWKDRKFPAEEFCRGRLARIATDLGAHALSPSDAFAVLATQNDPQRSRSVDHDSGGFELDPLLELCTTIWQRTPEEERAQLKDRARLEELFPVHCNADRTIRRIALVDSPAFYPPQAAHGDLPLGDVRFMAHPLCWGALKRSERRDALGDRMTAWEGMFDVEEYRFETVVQAAVVPALRRENPSEDALAALQDPNALAAVCQLAGRHPKPDRPLRYQRIDRTLFPLARLPVPCRGSQGVREWKPAYQVYFGSDWVEGSVERLADVLPDAGPRPRFSYLAPPEELIPLLDDAREEADDDATEHGDDVDEDDDPDAALETDAKARWIAFLTWIGVNQALRLVHFSDVDDERSGWVTTKDLAKPSGRAFKDLDEPWSSFERDLRKKAEAQADLETHAPYLYEAHDLDQVVPLIRAAETDETSVVARALFDHFARNWGSLARYAECQLALVDRGTSPSRRKSGRAHEAEVHDAGDNLWVRRLKGAGVCPTAMGPRPPRVTWQSSGEVRRRFEGRGRSAAQLLPVLDPPRAAPEHAVRAVADRLGVRADPSPSTFGLEDASLLCNRLESLYSEPQSVTESSLRDGIRPVYRQLFELLSGEPAGTGDAPLKDAPLLAQTEEGWRFVPASGVLYAETSGFLERSRIAGKVPTFVLEGYPAATRPLRELFGVRALEEAIEWIPDPGESALEPAEVERMQRALQDLMAPLLARVRAERTSDADLAAMRDFLTRVEPVERLALDCRLDGNQIEGMHERSYFVRGKRGEQPLQAFVVWDAPSGWPPSPSTARSLAQGLADALGINLVEAFLSFIRSSPGEYEQLLQLAGAEGRLREIEDELKNPTDPSEDPELETHPAAPPTPAPSSGEEEPAPEPSEPVPAPPPVPLFGFEDLEIDGEPIVIDGEIDPGRTGGAGGGGKGGGGTGGGGRAAPGTDVSALDNLGMRITVAYEIRRLRRDGLDDATADLTLGKESIVVDVHSPETIRLAEEASPVARRVLADLEAAGVSRLYPGFDILTIREGAPDRMIELKSSGVDARVQSMSWNEWKTARQSHLRESYWLYLVGNLRADLQHEPYVRAVRDPFGNLISDEVEEHTVRRAVQLRVREFAEAEHLDLGVISGTP